MRKSNIIFNKVTPIIGIIFVWIAFFIGMTRIFYMTHSIISGAALIWLVAGGLVAFTASVVLWDSRPWK